MKTVKIFSYATIVLSIASFIPVHAGSLDSEVYAKAATEICNKMDLVNEDNKKYVVDKMKQLNNALSLALECKNNELKNTMINDVTNELHSCTHKLSILKLQFFNLKMPLAMSLNFLFTKNLDILVFEVLKQKHELKITKEIESKFCTLFHSTNLDEEVFPKISLLSLRIYLFEEAIALARAVLKKLE